MADGERDDTADVPAAVAEAPAGSADSAGASESAEPAPLPPLLPSEPSKPRGARKAKRSKGRPRKYATAEEARAARNKREQEKRDRERAQAAAEAAAGISGSAVPGADTVHEPPAPTIGTLEQEQDAERERLAREASERQLAVLLGLGVDLGARYVPKEYGGGALTAEERELLGGVWATALAPYLEGPTSALMVAAVTTVQVFAVRMIAAQNAEPPQPAQPSEQRPPQAREHDPARPKPKPAAAAPQRKRVRVPTYTDDD